MGEWARSALPDQEDELKKRRINWATIVVYLVIFGALVALVLAGNGSLNKKPDELRTAEFYQLVRAGLSAEPNGQNSRVFAVQITEEVAYGLYTEGVTEDKFEKFKAGKANSYDFFVTVESAETFQNEMSRLIAASYPETFRSADEVTMLNYGFYFQLNKLPVTPWYIMLLPYLILLAAMIVPIVLIKVYEVPDAWWYLVCTVGLGEIISCGVLGLALYHAVKRIPQMREISGR